MTLVPVDEVLCYKIEAKGNPDFPNQQRNIGP